MKYTNINSHIGNRIRMYRQARGMTLQQLADRIHKSRASVSKYENGEITLDVLTLSELAEALDVRFSQLTDFPEPEAPEVPVAAEHMQRSPFFRAQKLYFYFYDGRYKRMKDGVIHIYDKISPDGSRGASLSISAVTPMGRSSDIYYEGRVLYSDMLIRFSFVNQCNTLEEDLLYIFNPLELRDFTEGLLCGISSADLMPCAFKCIVTLTPQELTEEFRQQLLITSRETRQWQKVNMMMIGNRG